MTQEMLYVFVWESVSSLRATESNNERVLYRIVLSFHMSMKPVFVILGIILLGLVLVSGCTQPNASRSYTNETYGFSFDPPEGWQQIDSELTTVAVWFSPQNSSNVSFIVGVPFSLEEGRALSTFADQVEEGLLESGLNYSILYRDWRPIPNAQAYEIAYVHEQDGVMEYVKQVAVLKTRTVFLITFFAPTTVSASYLTEVDRSIDTFM